MSEEEEEEEEEDAIGQCTRMETHGTLVCEPESLLVDRGASSACGSLTSYDRLLGLREGREEEGEDEREETEVEAVSETGDTVEMFPWEERLRRWSDPLELRRRRCWLAVSSELGLSSSASEKLCRPWPVP